MFCGINGDKQFIVQVYQLLTLKVEAEHHLESNKFKVLASRSTRNEMGIKNNKRK